MISHLKEFRARMDLTQAELAEAVGVRRETIVFLEQGKYNPSLRLANLISKHLNAKIDELFDFSDEV